MTTTGTWRSLCAATLLLASLMLAATASATTPIFSQGGESTLTSDATTASGQQVATVTSVACPSVGNCAAVGNYYSGSNFDAMVATESNGVWGSARALTLPSGATTAAGAQFAQLNSVACTGPGNCVAVGSYNDVETYHGVSGDTTTTGVQSMVATESNGVWGQASKLTLPSGADTLAPSGYDELESVACTSVGNCVAVGSYTDSGYYSQAMVASEANGVWGSASPITVPEQVLSELQSVACTGPGNCQAVGFYRDSAGTDHAMVVTDSNGSWGQASGLNPPSNDQASLETADLNSLACTSTGNCQAAGSYTDAAGSYQAMVVTETNGTWGQGTEIDLVPPGAAPTASGSPPQTDQLNSLSCTSVGNCVAAGSYGYVDDTRQAMVVSEVNGNWGEATELTLPNGAETVAAGESSQLNAVMCSNPGVCVAGGNYNDSGGQEAIVATSSPSLSITNTSLPSHTLDSPYSAQLTGVGGTEPYTWSVTGGSLPAGLTLASATGLISGLPDRLGTSTFTVTLTDSESPTQTTSATFSITISPPPVPHLGGVGGAGSHGSVGKGGVISVKMTCPATTGQVCQGTIDVTIVEHKDGNRILAVTASANRGQRHRTKKLVVGQQSYSIPGGDGKTIKLRLDAAGRRLLEEYGALPARLSVKPTGEGVAATRKLTLSRAR